MRRELAARALGVSVSETDRINALLELIDTGRSDYTPCHLPEGTLNIPEDPCKFCKGGDCWLNAPDSVLKCKGKCNSFQ